MFASGCAAPIALANSDPAAKALRPSFRSRDGFTIIELLVAMVITLIMMGAVATLFGTITGGIQDARATIEMTERLRSATYRLQQDLQGVTVKMLPPRRPESDEGYLEIIEGLLNDKLIGDPAAPTDLTQAGNIAASRFGDTDDVLMFTTRTRGEPFVGNVPKSIIASGTIQSQVAEVIYFVAQSPTSTAINPQFTLYRRCLLVVPSFKIPDGTTDQDVLEKYDISARKIPGTNPQQWVCNSLGDLTKRENRFAHSGIAPLVGQYPFAIDFTRVVPFSGTRYGEDAILSNLLAFDVLVYDPGVALKFDASKTYYLTPRDAGWTNGVYPNTGNGEILPYGAFVDLGYFVGGSNGATAPQMLFQNRPLPKSLLDTAYPTIRNTFDTGSLHYENNWVDSNNNGTPDAGEPGVEFIGRVDQSTNGFDDNNDGVVDDPDENETAPPYAGPLRGVRVVFRVYEPDSRQVREVNIEQDFTPE